MSKKAYEENDIQNIANAIREKNGSTDTYKVRDMAIAIENIPTGGDISEYFNENISNGTSSLPGWSECILKLPSFKFNGNDASYMFYKYPFNFLDLSNINTSETTNVKYMFSYIGNNIVIDIKNLDFSKVTDASNLFYWSTGIKNDLIMDNMDLNQCKNMQHAFYNTSFNISLKNVKMSNLESLYYSFYTTSCKTIDMTNCDLGSIKNIDRLISNNNLTNLIFGNNLGKGYVSKLSNYSNYGLSFQYCSKITHDSLMDVINKLYDLNLTYDVANGGTLYTQKLVLGSTNIAKLTAEEIQIATDKGWTVS